MIRKIPLLPTIIVAAAVAEMIRLGFWQLDRARERDDTHRRMVTQAALPVAPFPYDNPGDDRLLYRRLSASCDQVVDWVTRGGNAADGRTGWRHIATCRAHGHAQPFAVDVGVSVDPSARPSWAGGPVMGHSVGEPDPRTLMDKLRGTPARLRLMIVAETPAAGLAASRQPTPGDESNSSWAYMGQWFLFALTAVVIYALALRRRWRGRGD